MEYTINEERLTADEYIEFLKHTDLGSQYPKERFYERISTLVKKVSISLVARNKEKEIVLLYGGGDYIFKREDDNANELAIWVRHEEDFYNIFHY